MTVITADIAQLVVSHYLVLFFVFNWCFFWLSCVSLSPHICGYFTCLNSSWDDELSLRFGGLFLYTKEIGDVGWLLLDRWNWASGLLLDLEPVGHQIVFESELHRSDSFCSWVVDVLRNEPALGWWLASLIWCVIIRAWALAAYRASLFQPPMAPMLNWIGVSLLQTLVLQNISSLAIIPLRRFLIE